MSDGTMIVTRIVDDMTLLDIENIHARAVISLDGAYHHFACLETASRPDVPEILTPGKTHCLSTEISVER